MIFVIGDRKSSRFVENATSACRGDGVPTELPRLRSVSRRPARFLTSPHLREIRRQRERVVRCMEQCSDELALFREDVPQMRPPALGSRCSLRKPVVFRLKCVNPFRRWRIDCSEFAITASSRSMITIGCANSNFFVESLRERKISCVSHLWFPRYGGLVRSLSCLPLASWGWAQVLPIRNRDSRSDNRWSSQGCYRRFQTIRSSVPLLPMAAAGQQQRRKQPLHEECAVEGGPWLSRD